MLGFEYVASQIWTIREENLKTILEIAARINPSLSDLELSAEKKLSNKNESNIVDNVQVIDIIGPIIRYGNMFSDVSGARSLSSLKAEFNEALQDDEVQAIMLNIDSPGGEANGINEFAEFIYNSRGTKPVVSYVSNLACSGAYWLASATDRIICNETSYLGSIGAVAVLRDEEEKDAKEGIKTLKFVSMNAPNKRPDLNTDEGKFLIQEQIDALGDLFISKVARNRSTEGNEITFKDVVKNYNKGGVLMGSEAVKAGLADELGSFESTLHKLQNGELAFQNKEETSLNVEDNIMKTKEEIEKVELEKVEPIAGTLIAPEVSKEDLETVKLENKEITAKYEDMLKEMAAMKQHTEAVEQKALKTEAQALVASLSDKILPAQVEDCVADYVRASNDDKALPIDGTSRVERLVATWEAIPVHLKKDESLTVLKNEDGDSDDEVAQLAALEKMATDYAEKQNAR